MKFSLIVFVVFFIVGCSGAEISGKYVYEKDPTITNKFKKLTTGLITELNFEGSYCKFVYIGRQMSAKYEIENDNIYVNVGGEMGTLSIKIIDPSTLKGEGWATGTYKKVAS